MAEVVAMMAGAEISIAERRHDLGSGLVIEPMSTSDADWAGGMCAAMEPWLSYPFSSYELVSFFARQDPAAPRFAVHLDGALVGALVIRRDWFRGPYVHMLAVAPQVQGRGLGARLLAWVEEAAASAGERNLWIAVTDSNTGARRLYERCGFEAVATLPGLVRDNRTEVLMRKRLTRGKTGASGLR